MKYKIYKLFDLYHKGTSYFLTNFAPRKITAGFGIFLTLIMFFPSVTFAATGYCSGVGSSISIEQKGVAVGDVLKFGTCLIEQSVVPLLFALAFLMFIYGVMKFMTQEKAEEKEKGRQFMLWGIIAFAVMFGVWGFVAIISNTFGVSNVLPILPQSSTP